MVCFFVFVFCLFVFEKDFSLSLKVLNFIYFKRWNKKKYFSKINTNRKNVQEKLMMNKSAMLELEFLSKRFGLSPSSVELHVR